MMKICIVTGCTWPARAGAYGFESSFEALSDELAKEHEVTLIGAAGSRTKGRMLTLPCNYGNLVSDDEQATYEWYRKDLLEQDFIIDASPMCLAAQNLYFWDRQEYRGACAYMRNGYDFSHPYFPSNMHWHGILLSDGAKYAFVNSMQDHSLDGLAHTVYPGVDTSLYAPVEHPSSDYLLFLSRPHPSKGILDFIALARRMPQEHFIMAFDMESVEQERFGREAIGAIRELPNIEYRALSGDARVKAYLYANAKALVVPLAKSYMEAFGMVFAESLACGTPVITSSHGSPAEMLDGRVAVRCASPEEYVYAVRKVTNIERVACRHFVEGRYDVQSWAQRLLDLHAELKR